MTDLTKNLVSYFFKPRYRSFDYCRSKGSCQPHRSRDCRLLLNAIRSFVFKIRKEPKASAKNLSSIFLMVRHCQEYWVCPSLGYYWQELWKINEDLWQSNLYYLVRGGEFMSTSTEENHMIQLKSLLNNVKHFHDHVIPKIWPPD